MEKEASEEEASEEGLVPFSSRINGTPSGNGKEDWVVSGEVRERHFRRFREFSGLLRPPAFI